MDGHKDDKMELYREIAGAVKRRWDNIAKPIDSLGLLEDNVVKLCAIAGSEQPYDLSRRALAILCADHGVVCEGVTQTGSLVTKIVAENFAAGKSSVNYMAQCAGVDVFTIDIGMDTPAYQEKNMVQSAVIDRKVARGTADLAVEQAMRTALCRQAIETGMDIVRSLKEQGYGIIATGEMGIGNTTPTSVLAAVLLSLSAEQVTGRGAGLNNAGMDKKRRVIEQAIARVREKKLTNAFDILSEVGGYEIAGMVGIFLGGVRYNMPIVIDGAISAVSALVATQMDDRVPYYAIASHVSEEVTGQMALSAMHLQALIHGRMCLGEGSGAVAVMPVLDMGLAVYANMGTFQDLQIEAYNRDGKTGSADWT
ncbi:MAG: nicotinate-nucleotide--dimethylbenzimidazole phosphoribosyltransferase [Wujia sp.]